MRLPSYRPLFAAAALLMALSGAITLAIFSGGDTAVHAVNVWTVEVNEQGFNPRHCNIVRGDEVYFKNTGKVPIRVFKPGHGGLPDDPDWTLQPNETTASAQKFNFGGESIYKSGLGHEVTIFSPNNSNGTPGCQKEAPTPTPTPTRTATPTATPPPPRPAKCTWNGCAISIGVAYDE